MKPPMCDICGNKKHQDNILIAFEPEKNQKPLLNNEVGHPVNLIWFCKSHSKLVRDLTNYRYSEIRVIVKSLALQGNM